MTYHAQSMILVGLVVGGSSPQLGKMHPLECNWDHGAYSMFEDCVLVYVHVVAVVDEGDEDDKDYHTDPQRVACQDDDDHTYHQRGGNRQGWHRRH